MNKASKIALAAALSTSLAYATPASADQTTARDFIQGLSLDFAAGDLASVEIKLSLVSDQGFEAIIGDREQISLARLIALLGDVREGELGGERVAASLRKLLKTSSDLRFIFGDVGVEAINIDGGSPFPADWAA